MFLADKASDDGSGIWCSEMAIQRHTELSESTVKHTIIDFLREAAVEVENLEVEKILATYPEDRIRDRRTSLRLISGAVKAGMESDDLLAAVKAYAK